MEAKVFDRAEPMLKVPWFRVKAPAIKPLVATVVPPVPYWVILGKVAPALGVKV